jgi:hypothetical protein
MTNFTPFQLLGIVHKPYEPNKKETLFMGKYAAVKLPDGTTCTSGPECRLHGDMHTFMTQVTKAIREQSSQEDVTKKTPVDIDTKLSEIYDNYYKAKAEVTSLQKSIATTKQRMDPSYRFYRARDVPTYERSLNSMTADLEKAEQKQDAIMNKATPYEAEYQRRGRWTRAFLVDNASGHVHKSMDCSTCYSSTEFTWLPEYSGQEESGIVQDAGEAACTVCYPSAPVEGLKRKSVIESPARKEARLERETAKAERDKKAADKGITNPDGSVLKLAGKYGDVIKAARTAEITAVSTRVDLIVNEKNPDYWRSEVLEERQHNYATLITALAHKAGTSEDEIVAQVEKKAQAKYKKEWT